MFKYWIFAVIIITPTSLFLYDIGEFKSGHIYFMLFCMAISAVGVIADLIQKAKQTGELN